VLGAGKYYSRLTPTIHGLYRLDLLNLKFMLMCHATCSYQGILMSVSELPLVLYIFYYVNPEVITFTDNLRLKVIFLLWFF